MSTPEFASVFAADLTAERHPFTVEGKEGFISVRKMDFGARSQYDACGMKFNEKGAIAEIDNQRRATFLLSRSIVDYCLWLRGREKETGKPTDLQQTVPPEGRKARELWLEANIGNLDGEFGKWLHDLCLRVNGLHADQEGNSEASSPG